MLICHFINIFGYVRDVLYWDALREEDVSICNLFPFLLSHLWQYFTSRISLCLREVFDWGLWPSLIIVIVCCYICYFSLPTIPALPWCTINLRGWNIKRELRERKLSIARQWTYFHFTRYLTFIFFGTYPQKKPEYIKQNKTSLITWHKFGIGEIEK